jgi:F-type H+-transporting ATPase subunit epsilon
MPLKCVVVTPENTILETEADSVVFPAVDGEVGVLPKRMPMVARIGHGELRLKTGGMLSHRLFVSGGFAQVRNDVVTILAGVAATAEEINVAEVQKHLAAAEAGPASSPESRAEKNRIVGGLKARIRFAERK